MHPTSSPGVGEADAIVLAGRYVEGTGPAIAGHSTVPAPTLERRLERWAASGLHRIVLCAPDATVTLREQFGDAANGVRLDYVDADPALGSGGALRLAAERLRTPTAWILPSDPRGHLDLFGVWEWHHLRPSRITVATAHLADTRFLHRLEVDASDRVRAISVRDRVGGAGRVGLGFYLPFNIVLTYTIGTVLRLATDRFKGHAFSENVGIPIAAGLIVGEALVGVGNALLAILKTMG